MKNELGISNLKNELRKCANPVRAEGAKRFFKQPVNDQFIGVPVPQCRTIARKYRDLSLKDLTLLMASPFHEERSVALIILNDKFRRGDERAKKQVYELLMKMKHTLDSWDSVDLTAPYIVGAYLFERDRSILYKLARSRSLWDRRIAMVATFHFIRKNQLQDTFAIAEILLDDTEDLIHKATGWMLREAGKKDVDALQAFLKKHYSRIPRTALRYAIERFPEKMRREFLEGTFANKNENRRSRRTRPQAV